MRWMVTFDLNMAPAQWKKKNHLEQEQCQGPEQVLSGSQHKQGTNVA